MAGSVVQTRRAAECFIGELNRSEGVREGFPEEVMWRLRPEEDLEIRQVEEENVLSRRNGTCKGSEPGRCVDETVSDREQVHGRGRKCGEGPSNSAAVCWPSEHAQWASPGVGLSRAPPYCTPR